MLSVVVTTYRRRWALRFSFNSLKNQTRPPDEVVVVLKPSGDGSEEVINRFSDSLNIKLVIQQRGNVTDAVSMGIEESQGDIIAFLDDDAVAERQWIEKYLNLFEKLPDAGGIGGVTCKALIGADGQIIKTNERFYDEKPTTRGVHRIRPLSILEGYNEFISESSFPARLPLPAPIVRSVLLAGHNMAFRKKVLLNNDLARAYKESRIGHLYESYLALCAILRGYNTYRAIDPSIGPVVWHIYHSSSLQREPLKSEFWRSHDLAYNYWRLKCLGLKTSLIGCLMGLIVTSRRKPNIRIPAYAYGFIKGAIFYYKIRPGRRRGKLK